MSLRPPLIEDFLHSAGWADAQRAPLAGDASARSYLRLRRADGGRAILMDAPPGCGDDVADFTKIALHLRGLGLSAPEIFALDAPKGLMLLEDLGDAIYTQVIDNQPEAEAQLCLSAAEVLVHLQAAPPPQGLPALTPRAWAESTRLVGAHYAHGIRGQTYDPAPLEAALCAAILQHANAPPVLILRDFHAGNLLWLPERQARARVGLLDFQLAQMGQPEYDLVSLLQDARRDVAPDTEERVLRHFAALRGADLAQSRRAYAVMGTLRALRILGIFARLAQVAGKDQYLVHLPRVWRHLQSNLAHPALHPLRAICQDLLPPPTPENIERIRASCPCR